MIKPVDLNKIKITDTFWAEKMELVRREVLPYQWKALNDQIEGAIPSYAIRNFCTAAQIKKEGMSSDVFHGPAYQDSDLYKWIEAVAYSLADSPDEGLMAVADGVIDLMENAQADDGYLNTYFIVNGRDREFTMLWRQHELYCFGHMAEAAVAYYQATGKKKLLDITERFADYIASKIGPEEGKKHGYPGHEEAELALVKLYNATGKKKYLDQAAYYVNERGRQPIYFEREDLSLNRFYHHFPERFADMQANRPVREQQEAIGHAVRAAYLYTGMADVARETGDESLKECCERMFRSISEEKMYITGGIGASKDGECFAGSFDLPGDTAYSESCAAIGLAIFCRRMLQFNADSRYSDVMERALYNTMLDGIALDGKTFFYVNPLECVPENCRHNPSLVKVKPVRQKWFTTSCCPPNIARTIESIGQYVYTEDEETVYTHLYIGSTYKKDYNGKTAAISQTAEDAGSIKKITFSVSGGTGLTLALRMPYWCDAPVTSDFRSNIIKKENGYVYVKITSDEEKLTLELPMRVHIIEADSRVRYSYGKIALTYGPFVYAIEGADNGENLHEIHVSRDVTAADAKLFDIEICGQSFTAIKLPGLRIKRGKGMGLYHEKTGDITEPVNLTFIPYHAWANRGENEMSVWVKCCKNYLNFYASGYKIQKMTF